MFTITRTRVWLGAGAMLLAGLGVGCQHTRHNKCSPCDSKSACTVCSTDSKHKVIAKSTTSIAQEAGKATAMPVESAPTVATPAAPATTAAPAVSNERFPRADQPTFTLPEPPASLPPATTEKPKSEIDQPAPAETKTEPNTVVIPPVGHEVFVPRRSFADITAKPEFGRAPDYSWLTGELSYLPQKQQWRLRFAAIDEEDKYGGSVTLDARIELQSYQSGQLVRVEGAMLDPESREVAPKYRVKEISRIK
jgi:hypothetical protein